MYILPEKYPLEIIQVELFLHAEKHTHKHYATISVIIFQVYLDKR